MNKKLIYILIVLAVGVVFLSACSLINQEEVGAKIAKRFETNGNDIPIQKQLGAGEGGWVECSCSNGEGSCDPKFSKYLDADGTDSYKVDCVSKSNDPCSGSCGGTLSDSTEQKKIPI